MNRGELPTKLLSDSNWGALDHSSHASQLLSDKYLLFILHVYPMDSQYAYFTTLSQPVV